MKRREVISASSLFVIGSLAGCLTGLSNSGSSERERVQFERIHGEFTISIRNGLEEAVESVVTVTDDSGSAEEARRSLDPGATAKVVDPFDGGSAMYTVTVTVEGRTLEKETTPRPGETPENEFVYRITPDGITFRKGYRPAADVVISNDREDAVDVRVEVDGPSEGGTIYDVLTVAGGDVTSYRNVFETGTEYDVTVRADGMSGSTTHLNTETNSLWVAVEDTELPLDVGEQ